MRTIKELEDLLYWTNDEEYQDLMVRNDTSLTLIWTHSWNYNH